jgi:two-component system sensor histidine kinase/response regulator
VRCGLLVLLKQKFDDVIPTLEGVDFAIAKPVQQVAIQRLLSSDEQFWLDRNENEASTLSFDKTRIGANILVAEDNPVNQKLISEVLRIFDCEMTLVDNGKEAVAMNEKNQFDLILMDCQMPEMDGYQATKMIRSQELKSGAQERTMIVALTANARKEDRDKCLACGMDDYISKPFTIKQVRDVILKLHLGEEISDDNSSHSYSAIEDEIVTSAASDDDGLLDLKTLNGIRALQNPQSSNILEQLVEIYRNHAPELTKNLNLSIKEENCASIREFAHSLKSASGNIGARKIFELSAKLEDMGRDEKIDGASKILEEIEQVFPKIYDLLEQEIRRDAA